MSSDNSLVEKVRSLRQNGKSTPIILETIIFEHNVAPKKIRGIMRKAGEYDVNHEDIRKVVEDNIINDAISRAPNHLNLIGIARELRQIKKYGHFSFVSLYDHISKPHMRERIKPHLEKRIK